MTITEALLPKLKEKFKAMNFQIGNTFDPIVVFPPIHPEVGKVEIADDGDEVTIHIEKITHGHFGYYDEGKSPPEQLTKTVDAVIKFLDDLFNDRVLLWSKSKGWGGWKLPYAGVIPDDIPKEAKLFLWSGPISRPN